MGYNEDIWDPAEMNEQKEAPFMSISQRPFGVTPNGEKVTEYTMTNRDGASVSMLDFGGIITRILVPDRDGKLDDVSLSFDDIDVYAQGRSGSMGMLIGRVGNRIRGASFELEGRTYTLPKNNNGNCLHGGMGFGLRMWQARPVLTEGGDALELTLTSQDGDQGFPGTLKVKVTYTFTDHNELGIHYQASTDKTTLCSLTNHAYFNLDGHASGSVRDLEMQINADLVTEVGEGLIPTGRLLPVSEVPYNFTSPTRIGDVLDKTPDCPGMTMAKGVDFNFCAGRDRETKVIATLYSPKTGRVMDVITDQPGVQCYTGNNLNNDGKDGVHYGPYAGVCLETQHYPDSIHHPHFPSVVLRPQDTYDTLTIYRFGVR